jgi:hypothetical protein
MAALSAGVITVSGPISTRVATSPTATIAQITTTTVQPLLHSRALPPIV